MKTMKKILAAMLSLALLAGCLSACGTSDNPSPTPGATQPGGENPPAGGSELDPNKKVTKIAVGSDPAKTAYTSGEAFSLEGGTIIVTYDDGTTQELPMTASCFDIKEPGMTSSGTKTVSVKCGSASTRFTCRNRGCGKKPAGGGKGPHTGRLFLCGLVHQPRLYSNF